jgi:hypothetical protein
MNIGVVTTLNDKLYNEYGHRFFETYNWPFDLHVYSEDTIIIPNKKIISKNTFDEVSSCKEFATRNKDKFKGDKLKDFWADGVRFCYKVYAYTDFLKNNKDYDGIICIDADSVFYKPININWIKEHIHRDDCMMTYLGRPNYSECGFLYFNMKHPETKNYAKEMKNMYDTDHIYKLNEQHDSFIWDYVRMKFENDKGITNYNIGDGRVGHVQARSILGTIYDHTKGPKRKQTGKSPEARV